VQSRPRKNKLNDELKERERQAFLPYVQGTTDKTGKIFRKYNINTIYCPLRKIKQIIRPIKDKRPFHIPPRCIPHFL